MKWWLGLVEVGAKWPGVEVKWLFSVGQVYLPLPTTETLGAIIGIT